MSGAALLDLLVSAVAKAVAAELREGVDYSQDNLPPGIKTKRAFLDRCARGDFPNRKVGRLRLVSREDFADWMQTRGRPVRRLSASHRATDQELLHGPTKKRQ